MKICHRDLKLENLLITGNDVESSKLKLIDFGLCYCRRQGQHLTSEEYVGTDGYISPEICNQKPYVPEESDMWTVGIVLFSMISKQMPFTGKDKSEMRRNVRIQPLAFEGAAWATVSAQTKAFIEALLCKEGRNRPSAADALEMANICRSKLEESREQATSERKRRRTLNFDFLLNLGGLFNHNVERSNIANI
eukprot:Plantae.Rhodophyta-Rhodochaete_pulchella.ctg20671.p1 GENE.Plantae.Rhodophyta-Rhodochaete_pulchella.ctg20671~~Plantae.Rhodophyta-Rhodochaete_pulchella.ctg20671.p1  ORF type:complete len:193 (-),score=27.49 Plantae.Rhodophyta-Rhodochaete_pulchella.ctg20671:361-939(-)